MRQAPAKIVQNAEIRKRLGKETSKLKVSQWSKKEQKGIYVCMYEQANDAQILPDAFMRAVNLHRAVSREIAGEQLETKLEKADERLMCSKSQMACTGRVWGALRASLPCAFVCVVALSDGMEVVFCPEALSMRKSHVFH